MPDLNGRDFRALRRLSTKDDRTLAEVGDTCERVPASSLAPLLASGKIEPVARPATEAEWVDLGRPGDEPSADVCASSEGVANG